MSLKDLVTQVTADGSVSALEVEELKKAVLADGTVDREEADALFEVNTACSENPENAPEWETFFVDAVSSHILADGNVDEEEATYLIGKIEGDGKVDKAERALLANLKAKAKSIHPSLLSRMTSLGL